MNWIKNLFSKKRKLKMESYSQRGSSMPNPYIDPYQLYTPNHFALFDTSLDDANTQQESNHDSPSFGGFEGGSSGGGGASGSWSNDTDSSSNYDSGSSSDSSSSCSSD